MKKVICFVLGATLAVAAGAQTWQDALLFSENNYSGTARGVGMGNALTAIGGDPGSLTFNPAGSAVASYSQFEITPGLTFSLANVGAAENMPYMADKRNTFYGAAKMPNLGFIFNLDTGRRSGLKRMSFGFVVNATNNFTGRFNGSGVNDDNSYAASLATSADGFASNVLANEDWYYGDPARMPAWVDMTGYRAGMFNGVTGRDGAYIALTEVMDSEGNFRLAAPVYQEYGQQTRGSKHDILLNYALNFSDKFYIGANLGVTVLRYALSEYWKERPDNPADFPIIQYSDGTTAQFESLRMNRNYRLEGNGVYFKIGALWRPVAGLRIGAAFQTPTMINLRERYGYSGEVILSGRYGGNASSPEDDWIYALRTPLRANFGLAYTLGTVAVLSADYEYVNYASALFRSRTSNNEYSTGSFSDVNMDIRDLLGVSHQLRVGTEVKVTPGVALRAGYNLITSGEREANFLKHNVSAGVGFSFGSFFLDAAIRARFVPAEYYVPYYYFYAPNPNQFYNKVIDDDIVTPEIKVKAAMLDALVTLGWRF